MSGLIGRSRGQVLLLGAAHLLAVGPHLGNRETLSENTDVMWWTKR